MSAPGTEMVKLLFEAGVWYLCFFRQISSQIYEEPTHYCGNHRRVQSAKLVILLIPCISNARKKEEGALAQCSIM